MSRITRRAALGLGAGTLSAAALAPYARADIAQAPGLYPTPREELANRLTLDQKIRQLLLQSIHGAGINDEDPRNMERYGVATPAEVLKKHRIGGVILRPDPGQFTSLQAIFDYLDDLQRVADQEVGVPLQVVWEGHLNGIYDAGIPITEFPEPMVLGAYESLRFGSWGSNNTQTGEAAALGIKSWYGISADIGSNPNNPVLGNQVFGGNPEIVLRRAITENNGAYAAPMRSGCRMFPGAGDISVGDSGLPVLNRSREEWDALEGAVYKDLAKRVDVVQIGHIVAPGLEPDGYPASLSWTIINQILRKELGFTGVVTTDSLSDPVMRKFYSDKDLAKWMIAVGVNQLYDSADPSAAVEGVLEGIEQGYYDADIIHSVALRILDLKPYEYDEPWPSYPGRSSTEREQRYARAVARGGVTVVHNDGLLPIRDLRAVVVTHHEALGKELATQLGEGTDLVLVGVDPSQQEIDAAVTAAGRAGVAVVLTDGVAAHPTQKQLVDALTGAGNKVVAVATGLPYDVGLLDASAKVATYSSRALMAMGLAEVLTGAYSPLGKLPVVVPTADGGELPIGTGLTW